MNERRLTGKYRIRKALFGKWQIQVQIYKTVCPFIGYYIKVWQKARVEDLIELGIMK